MDNNTFNPDNLIKVTSTGRKDTDFDLRYLTSQDRWQVSDQAFNTLDLGWKGLNFHTDIENNRVLVSVQDRENSTFMRGRNKEEATKGREFTATILRTLLDKMGHKSVNRFALEPVGTNNGIQYLEIVVWNHNISPLSPLSNVGEDQEDQEDTIAEAVEVEQDTSQATTFRTLDA